MKKILSIVLVMTILCSYIPFASAEDEVVIPLEGYDASGIYTEAQYDYVKTKIAAKEEPWFSAYEKMLSLADEWINEEPSAVEYWYVPGFYGDADGHKAARQTLMNDAKSAYACAVAYKFTGKKKYAEQTIRILDDWTKLTSLGYEDSGLVFSYVGDSLIMSADLVKGYPYWTKKAAFDTWVKDYYLNLANKSWSTGNSGDWNLLARSVGYAYLGDNESLKDIIIGSEEQSGSLKYLIARIREDGILHKELERGNNGLWYSYFALAPMTACCQVLYNNLGEDYFNWQSSDGRSVKKAVETYFYYCNHIEEWNQAYSDYYNGTKTTSASYPSPLLSTDWPLPLFEAMAGVYNNQDFCDYVGRYRPVYGTINDGIYHHFAWFFPTLMYGSLQLGGGLPEYVLPDEETAEQAGSDFAINQYYQDFEDNVTISNSTTDNNRDKYAVLENGKEIYYIEKSSGTFDSNPVTMAEDGIYGGVSPSAALSNNSKVVVNLPRTYSANDGLVSLEMRLYRPSDNTTISFYEEPVEEAYNIPSENKSVSYIFNVKYARFFFNSNNANAAKLPSGADYYNYNFGTWTHLKLDFDFSKGTVRSYYKDARNDKSWQRWGIDNNTFNLSGDGIGAIVFSGKGSARIDDVRVTTQPVYLDYENGQLTGVVKDASLINKAYQLQSSAKSDFESVDVEYEGIFTGEPIVYTPECTDKYMRLVIDGKATAPVDKINCVYALQPDVYRYNSSDTDWSVDALSGIKNNMYGSVCVVNTSSKTARVALFIASYGKDETMNGVKSVTVDINANSYKVLGTQTLTKIDDTEYVKIIAVETETLRPIMTYKQVNKW